MGGGAIWFGFTGIAAVLWLRARRKRLRARFLKAADLLSGRARTDVELEVSIFRDTTTQRRSRFMRKLESRYPLTDPRKMLGTIVLAGIASVVGVWLALWFMRIPISLWTMPFFCTVPPVLALFAASATQRSQEIRFIRRFPEVVDQITRVARAGVPPLEAISVVVDDVEPPIGPALREISDGLSAGLSVDSVLDMTSRRVALAEFTLFTSILRLQRKSGSGVSEAFLNLASTLRESRNLALKARAATAQTRLSLLVLVLMPAVVLAGQSVISPRTIDVLFATHRGVLLLRIGVGMIVAGLLVARMIAARTDR